MKGSAGQWIPILILHVTSNPSLITSLQSYSYIQYSGILYKTSYVEMIVSLQRKDRASSIGAFSSMNDLGDGEIFISMLAIL